MNKVKNEKAHFALKAAFVVFLCLAMFAMMALLTSCGNSNPDAGETTEVNYDNLLIKNWSTYSSIGVGVESDSSASAESVATNSMSAQAVEATSKDKRNILLGIDEHGNYEKIRFEDENGEETEQTLSIYSFSVVKNFTFFTFVENYSGTVLNCSCLYWFETCYMVDNATGKIYNLSEPLNELGLAEVIFGEEFYFSESSFYARCYKEGDEDEATLYRFHVSENQLVIEKIIELSKLANVDSYFVDKFDNVYFGDVYAGDGECKFLYHDGTISGFDYQVKLAMNGIVYVEDEGKRVNANGELEDSTFIGTVYYTTDYLVLDDGTSQYYYHVEASAGYFQRNQICKITFTDEEVFETEYITLEDFEEYATCVVAYGSIFFIDSTEVYRIDIKTGAKTVISSGVYIINSIYSDNQGNVIFEGIDQQLNNVVGMIDENDNLTLEVYDSGYEVYFVSPIN